MREEKLTFLWIDELRSLGGLNELSLAVKELPLVVSLSFLTISLSTPWFTTAIMAFPLSRPLYEQTHRFARLFLSK